MRILFLVRGLNVGGAQRQLVVAARGLRRAGHRVAVAVFYGGGAFEEDLRAEGVPIHDLGKRGRWDNFTPLARLGRLVHSERPDVLHAYMPLANVCSALVKPFARSVKVVWGIRSAQVDLDAYDWLSKFGSLLDRIVSPLADAVVVNSESAARTAAASGIDRRKMTIIPNGIDCERFRPDPGGRARLRAEWGIPDEAPIIGMVARLDPVKNHGAFLKAASRVVDVRDVRLVCVGDGEPRYRKELERLASDLGLSSRLTWVGELPVTSAVYSAMDVLVLSSDAGESFPNVVAEAMACGTPCVVSDSGDASLIVGDTGAVVPPGDPTALAFGIIEVLDRTRRCGDRLAAQVRARVEKEYSLELLVARTEKTLERVTAVRP